MFGLGRKKILGIDIGTSSLKVAELELRDGRPYLSNYAWMDIVKKTKEAMEADQDFLKTVVPQCLKKLFQKGDFKSREAFISIPDFGGLVTLIELPAMPTEDLEQAVRFEAHKYIPTDLDEVSISWEVVGEKFSENDFLKKKDENDLMEKSDMNKNRKIQVLLTAASKNKIASYEEIAKNSGLKLKGVEIESIALAESLVGNDQGNFIIIDIGYRVCSIIYVEKGVIRANRNIDSGGSDLTATIAKGMGISESRAENLKIAGNNFFSVESSLRFSALDLICSETARILGTLSKGESGSGLDSIILSGGTAGLIGLVDFFQTKFGVKTIIGNPFGRVSYEKKNGPLIEKLKSRFAVSIGLALRGIEEQSHKNK